MRNRSLHLISKSNATPRTASPQRYPPNPPNSPLNKLRIASITPRNGANKSAIPPRLPNKSPKIITILLSLLFELLVPCRFSLPYCGRPTDSGCSRGSPLGHIVWCFRETEQPVSESQIRRSQDHACVTSRCKKQLAHTKVIQALAISPAPSSNLSGAPGCHRSRIPCLPFLVHCVLRRAKRDTSAHDPHDNLVRGSPRVRCDRSGGAAIVPLGLPPRSLIRSRLPGGPTEALATLSLAKSDYRQPEKVDSTIKQGSHRITQNLTGRCFE